jgi:hypothetical protein
MVERTPAASRRRHARNLTAGVMMNIIRLESFLTNCGLRNYLFVRLTTDDGRSNPNDTANCRPLA